jgi:hypothetical protein
VKNADVKEMNVHNISESLLASINDQGSAESMRLRVAQALHFIIYKEEKNFVESQNRGGVNVCGVVSKSKAILVTGL